MIKEYISKEEVIKMITGFESLDETEYLLCQRIKDRILELPTSDLQQKIDRIDKEIEKDKYQLSISEQKSNATSHCYFRGKLLGYEFCKQILLEEQDK